MQAHQPVEIAAVHAGSLRILRRLLPRQPIRLALPGMERNRYKPAVRRGIHPPWADRNVCPTLPGENQTYEHKPLYVGRVTLR